VGGTGNYETQNTYNVKKNLHAEHAKFIPNGLMGKMNYGDPLATLPGLDFMR
jgi:hypothetical protein